MSRFLHLLIQLAIGFANAALAAHYAQGNPWPAAIAAGSASAIATGFAIANHKSNVRSNPLRSKLFNFFLIVCFLGIVVPAHAQSVITTGPFTFVSDLKHVVLKGASSVLDFAEEYVANPVIKADYYVDEANGEDPDAAVQVKLAKAQVKRAAKLAKKAAKASAKAAPKGK